MRNLETKHQRANSLLRRESIPGLGIRPGTLLSSCGGDGSGVTRCLRKHACASMMIAAACRGDVINDPFIHADSKEERNVPLVIIEKVSPGIMSKPEDDAPAKTFW